MGEQRKVRCTHCQSENQSIFSSEIAVHFRGLEGLNKPIVWVFQDVLACLNCGHAEFTVPGKELEVLRTGSPVEGAAVWLGGSGDREEDQR